MSGFSVKRTAGLALPAAIALLAAVSIMLAGSRSAQAAVAPVLNPLPPLIACPNLDASPDNKVSVADILSAVKHFNKNYGQVGYSPLWDLVSPYNTTSPSGTGSDNIADIIYVVQQFGHTCSALDTQIATATLAIGDPLFSSKFCDDAGAVKFQNAVSCGGDPQFLTENSSFLLGRGYRTTGIDVPGQGVHYVNFAIFDSVFNPARPEGLVYKGGKLIAQLYYADGDSVGWGPDRADNKHAVNTDSFCTAVAGEPPGTGCGWSGTNDGWHWHENLCTIGIGSSNPLLSRQPSQQACSDWAASLGMTCTFPPTPNFNCTWSAAVGWMGHLWNWLPNANYTNAVDANGLGLCQVAYCATGESNGSFADCFPDTQGWNAYNCPS